MPRSSATNFNANSALFYPCKHFAFTKLKPIQHSWGKHKDCETYKKNRSNSISNAISIACPSGASGGGFDGGRKFRVNIPAEKGGTDFCRCVGLWGRRSIDYVNGDGRRDIVVVCENTTTFSRTVPWGCRGTKMFLGGIFPPVVVELYRVELLDKWSRSHVQNCS